MTLQALKLFGALLLSGLVVPAAAVGQQPRLISFAGCVNHSGQRVLAAASTARNDVVWANRSPTGDPMIYYHPIGFPAMPQHVQRFFWRHECGHHALAHEATALAGKLTEEIEQAADCFAIRTMWDEREMTRQQVKSFLKDIQASMHPVGDRSHKPAADRIHDIKYQCLDEKFDWPMFLSCDRNLDEDCWETCAIPPGNSVDQKCVEHCEARIEHKSQACLNCQSQCTPQVNKCSTEANVDELDCLAASEKTCGRSCSKRGLSPQECKRACDPRDSTNQRAWAAKCDRRVELRKCEGKYVKCNKHCIPKD